MPASDAGRNVSLIDLVRRGATEPAPPPLPRQRNPLEYPNPWVRMAYHEGIDWARRQRELWGRPVDWKPPVDEWARWCEGYYLAVMRDYGWTPDPGGSAHLTQQQKDTGDAVSIGLALATERLYPNPPQPQQRGPRHAAHHDHP